MPFVKLVLIVIAIGGLPLAGLGALGKLGKGHPGGGGGGASVAVPGPVAGVGLPAFVLIGGYVWLRRRRAKSAGTPPAR